MDMGIKALTIDSANTDSRSKGESSHERTYDIYEDCSYDSHFFFYDLMLGWQWI
jgi:hypothetical protein